MDENQDQQSQEEVVEEQVEEVAQEVKAEADRPEINYKAELERKNREIERLRAERESSQVERKRDPADITTWSDQELKMLMKSPDPNVAPYKDQAEELLLERKVKAIQAREYEQRRRVEADVEVKNKYPEMADPNSEFSANVEKVMRDYDLHKTPAGRLLAAKIVASEGKNADAKGRKKEADRVATVKGQLVEGDRPKPTESHNPKKTEELEKHLISGKEQDQVQAISQILKDRGMSRDSFFGNKK